MRIYVKLLNEVVDVWRPVDASWWREDVYQILSENHCPEGEAWEFSLGDLVRCRQRTFSGGATGLVAFERICES
jgi:hypothetical protein